MLPLIGALVLCAASGRPLCADDDVSIDAEFSVLTSTRVVEEQERYVDLEGDVEFQFEITDRIDTFLELEAEPTEIEVEEISIRWKLAERLRLKIGAFDNEPLLEEYVSDYFATDGLLSETLQNLGYLSKSSSVTLYRNYEEKDGGPPLSYVFVLKQIPSTEFTPQADAGFFYHFAGEESYLGLQGVFAPLVKTLPLSSGDSEQAYLVNLFVASFEKRFIYAVETVYGSNIITPASIISNGDISESSPFFLGTDMYAGYTLFEEYPTWTPLLRWSALFPDTSDMEIRQFELILGNRLRWSEDIVLNVDVGLRMISDFFPDPPTKEYEPHMEILFEVEL
jgi:hypothetical protein